MNPEIQPDQFEDVNDAIVRRLFRVRQARQAMLMNDLLIFVFASIALAEIFRRWPYDDFFISIMWLAFGRLHYSLKHVVIDRSLILLRSLRLETGTIVEGLALENTSVESWRERARKSIRAYDALHQFDRSGLNSFGLFRGILVDFAILTAGFLAYRGHWA